MYLFLSTYHPHLFLPPPLGIDTPPWYYSAVHELEGCIPFREDKYWKLESVSRDETLASRAHKLVQADIWSDRKWKWAIRSKEESKLWAEDAKQKIRAISEDEGYDYEAMSSQLTWENNRLKKFNRHVGKKNTKWADSKDKMDVNSAVETEQDAIAKRHKLALPLQHGLQSTKKRFISLPRLLLWIERY